MKKYLILISVFVVSGFQLHGQDHSATTKKSEMGKLSALQGQWEGTGWYQQGQANRFEFKQLENVESKLDSTILLVEGKGFANDSLVFNAIAIFSYDMAKQNYKIESHLSDGRATEAVGKFMDNGAFQWGFDVPTGHIRYIINFNDTSWAETGEYSADGNQWWKFLEMNLTKK